MKATCIARVYSAAKTSLAFMGLAGIFGFTILTLDREALLKGVAPMPADLFGVPAEIFGVASIGAAEAVPAGALSDREQRAIAEFIAKRYRIAGSAATSFVSLAYRAGAEHSVDPLLILAVMAVESRYNPVAESVVGAKGLMQIIPKFHLDKLVDLGGEQALLEPEVNIEVGTQILREYTRRFGDPEFALQMYAGAVDAVGSPYATKVMAEKARLEPVRQKARKESEQSA
jgi:soluble lytic murein transglycosylase-like protein